MVYQITKTILTIRIVVEMYISLIILLTNHLYVIMRLYPVKGGAMLDPDRNADLFHLTAVIKSNCNSEFYTTMNK